MIQKYSCSGYDYEYHEDDKYGYFYMCEDVDPVIERLTRELDTLRANLATTFDDQCRYLDNWKAAEDALAKAREAMGKARIDVAAVAFHIDEHSFSLALGLCSQICAALAALAPAKTEGELRHQCAKSGRHDHDGCDCTAEELARRASKTEEK